MLKYLPINLKIKNKLVIIVGAGSIAERKIKTLLSFEPKIKVISPEITDNFKKIIKKRGIVHQNRIYKKGDLKNAFLVIAATSDNKVNQDVYKEALKRKILVNVIDNSKLSNFISPAILEKKGLMITVSTYGKNPKLAKVIRDKMRGFLNGINFNRD